MIEKLLLKLDGVDDEELVDNEPFDLDLGDEEDDLDDEELGLEEEEGEEIVSDESDVLGERIPENDDEVVDTFAKKLASLPEDPDNERDD